jgi:LysM repeat protein
VVGKGETLYGLARRYNVTVDALMRANNLTADNKLQAGQTLVIPSR